MGGGEVVEMQQSDGQLTVKILLHKENKRQGGWREKKALSTFLIMGDIKSNPY
jgi:hypothetical protein